MSRAVAADQTRAVQREYHRKILQGDVVNELVISALQERRINRDDGLEAFACKTRGKRNRVLFGYRHVEITVRKALRKFDEA